MKKTNSQRDYFFLSKNDYKLVQRAVIYLKPYKLLFLLTFITIITSIILNLSQPLFYGRVIDYIINKDAKLVLHTLLIILIITIVNGLISLAETYLTDLLGNKIIVDIKKDLYNHILNLPVKAFDELQVGELISRLEGDVASLSNILCFQSMRMILDVFTLVGIGVYIFTISTSLSWIVVCSFPVTYLVLNVFGKILRRKNEELKKYNDKYYSLIAESFSGIREVKALNIGRIVQNKFMALTLKIFKLRIRTDIIGALSGLSSMWLNSFARLIVMAVGGFQIIAGVLTMGTYVAFNSYSGQFNSSFQSVANLNVTLQQAIVSLERIFKLLDNFMMPVESHEGETLKESKGVLEFHNVTFGYETSQLILKNISLRANAEQVTAIVGASGSGKTTIFNLILQFYCPSQGSITIDNHDFRKLDSSYLRKEIAVVLQNPFFFNVSVKENLMLVKPDATMQEIKSACQKAHCHDFIENFDNGYETIVGENGTRLSGGQKQRLAIARAILKGSKILLFDEATSALDSDSEIKIRKCLVELSKNHTIIVIAHRLSTIFNADKIIVLQDGQVEAVGNHEQLLISNKYYKKIYKSQLIS